MGMTVPGLSNERRHSLYFSDERVNADAHLYTPRVELYRLDSGVSLSCANLCLFNQTLICQVDRNEINFGLGEGGWWILTYAYEKTSRKRWMAWWNYNEPSGGIRPFFSSFQISARSFVKALVVSKDLVEELLMRLLYLQRQNITQLDNFHLSMLTTISWFWKLIWQPSYVWHWNFFSNIVFFYCHRSEKKLIWLHNFFGNLKTSLLQIFFGPTETKIIKRLRNDGWIFWVHNQIKKRKKKPSTCSRWSGRSRGKRRSATAVVI